MDGEAERKKRKNIWYSGSLEITILLLEGVSPDTPRTCGHVSRAYQTPLLRDSKHVELND